MQVRLYTASIRSGVGAITFVTALLTSVLGLVSDNAWGQWKPTHNIELVVPASAGGGIDVTVRAIAAILKQHNIVDVPITVINKAGGGGELALNYLAQHPRDAHYLTIIAPNLVTNNLIQKTRLKYTDFSPIARLVDQYVVVGVKEGGPIRSAEDLVSALKQKSDSLSFGEATSLGNFNHMAIALVAKFAGVDPRKLKMVVFNSSGDSITALLGGHVDVVAASAINFIPYVTAGQLRAIGVAAARRLSGPLSDVPTFTERGIPSIVSNWRVIVAPKGISKDEVQFWESAFGRLRETPEWKRELERNAWVDAFLGSSDTLQFLDKEEVDLRNGLTELGLVK